MSDKLVNYIADMQQQEALALTTELLDAGTPPREILDDCSAAMEIVGKRFDRREYFLPELIMAGEMLTQITEELKPHLEGDVSAEKEGPKVLVGTVAGDIHDIGKDIVVFMLDVNGFQVRDLGVDVPADVFVDQIAEFEPQVVGLSGFLTLSYESMRATVEAIEAAGLRDGVKIMVGGGTVDEKVQRHAGADGFGLDAMEAVSLARAWTAAE